VEQEKNVTVWSRKRMGQCGAGEECDNVEQEENVTVWKR
jgi:hypothetical protein